MKTFLSLTTSPTRIHHLHKLLSDIDIDLFDEVVINIPKKFGRNGSSYVIPKELKNMKKVKLNVMKKDLGPISKIFSTIKYAKNSNDIIISIDDDIKHDPSLFPLLISYCKSKDVVVTGIGKNLSYWSNKKYGLIKRREPFEYVPKNPYVDLLEGFSGVAYKKKFFPNLNLLLQLSSLDKVCLLSDDLVLSYYLKLFGRRILSLSSIKKYGYHKLFPYNWGLKNNALHLGGGLNKNDVFNIDMNYIKYQQCYKYLNVFFDNNKKYIESIILKNWHHDFDKICIINMKNRPDRKKQSLSILQSLNVPKKKISIVTATTPNQNMVKVFNNLGLSGNSLKDFLSIKRYNDLKWHESKKNFIVNSASYYKKILIETAVSLSQLRVLKMAQDNHQTILMLEDDFGPSESFYNIASHKMHRQIDWEVLYFGDCPSMRSLFKKTLLSSADNSLIQSHTVCHHALAFKPSIGKKLLNSKNLIVPFSYPIDDELSYYLGLNKIKFGIFNKPLMVQDVVLGSNSNIQNKNKLKWELESSNKFQKFILKKL